MMQIIDCRFTHHHNDGQLQVYTGGVFSPMSEDGSDYQQMDSFQVVFVLMIFVNDDEAINANMLQRRGERLSGKQNDGSPQSLKDISHRFE